LTESKYHSLKTLLIIRHAKSSWENNLSDFERPLNERGIKDAPVMAQRLLDKKISIDTFISSPAKRAKKTAELFCDVYKTKITDIHFVAALYHAQAAVFNEVIKNIDDQFNTAAIFSHNPGITTFVNELVENVQIDNIPTCGIFAVTIDIDKWSDFNKGRKQFLFFDYPKLA
jgi:phosphohistidine phosphatase